MHFKKKKQNNSLKGVKIISNFKQKPKETQ